MYKRKLVLGHTEQVVSLVNAKFVAILAVLCLVLTLLGSGSTPALAADSEYTIYPTPHSISYGAGSVKLAKVDLVVENGIDADTQLRLDDTLSLQAIPAVTWKGDAVIPDGKGLSVLVGIKGSGGAVDKHVQDLVAAGKLTYDTSLFEKIDAHLLAIVPNVSDGRDEIIVLGKDTDAAFYGITSLYRIFQQITNSEVRALTIADYADVRNRGFIEGYYGNPWSTQDRIDLMTWGGYNKLNSYFYAPKDDPKHNAKWRELYTKDELANKIAPLAEAGNKSKVRFIYALHPFMHEPITSANYEHSVEILKKKFQQVIDQGVRQIAILADDATNQGSGLYTKLMKEMTDWVKDLQKQTNADGSLTYPGLKDTIVFCPVNYMGNGENWYRDLPDTVQVINTGGRVWGAAMHSFFSSFKSNSGRPTFMWMNFPCSDNDKDALHMGNYENFLGTDVQPGDLEGLVMNPMQQSEPSKQAIFMNAEFSWHLWDSVDHADQVWRDSFSYINHNSPISNKASNALRELSEHMRRMYGGGATWEARESAAVKADLVAFQNAIKSDSVSKELIEKVRPAYANLSDDVATFRSSGSTPALIVQMKPWLDAFDDLIETAKYVFDAYQAYVDNNNEALISNYQAANAQLLAYKNHAFRYVDHDEYARVGKAYLTPTIEAAVADLKIKAQVALDPDASVRRFITSRTDTPEGSISTILDGNDATGVTYKTPNKILKDTYIGITDTKPFDADSVKFVMGNASGKNYFDHGQLQYTTDGQEWKAVPKASEATTSPMLYTGLELKQITGLRLYATAENSRDAWLEVKEITVNPKATPTAQQGTVSISDNLSRYTGGGELQAASDGNTSTFLWTKPNLPESTQDYETIKDKTPVDAAVTVTYPQAFDMKYISFAQADGDQIAKGVIEYSKDGTSNWQKIVDVNSDKEINKVLDSPVHAKAIRVRNTERTNGWWKVAELSASATDPSHNPVTPTSTVTLSNGLGRYAGSNDAALTDGETKGGFVWTNAAPQKDASITVNYSGVIEAGAISFAQDSGDKITSGEIQVSEDGQNWTKVANVSGDPIQAVILETPQNVKGVRVVNGDASNKWWKVFELSAVSADDLADKAKLSQAIEDVKKLKETVYTVFTWQVLTGALASANEVFNQVSASQSDVDTAAEFLQRAVKGLKKASEGEAPVEPEPEPSVDKPTDFSVLKNTIKAVDYLSSTDYSTKTWADLVSALKAAQDVAKNDAATQDVVDSAAAALRNATKALAVSDETPVVPPVDPKDPADPEDPVEPIDPEEPTDPADPENPVLPSDPSQEKAPSSDKPSVVTPRLSDTGSRTAWMVIGALTLVLGGTVLATRRRHA